MLPAWIQLDSSPPSLDRPALLSPDGRSSWGELQHRVAELARLHRHLSGQKVGLPLAATVDSIAQLLALASVGAHLYLVASETSVETLRGWAADYQWAGYLNLDGTELFEATENLASDARASDAVTILTSGTTGKPKAVEHTWSSLTRPVRKIAGSHPTWLLTYRPHLYAGLQVMLQCLVNQGSLVMAGDQADADDVARLAADANVTFASATPSYWRWFLTLAGSESLQSMPLKQITLGGEAVDQATLNALQRVFADVRVVHIYATTELGRCFSVTDGKAGFPAKFLDQASADGVEMKIDDGELVVRSANGMAGYDRTTIVAVDTCQAGDWFRTGDLVAMEADRVFFVGRKTDMINVGGNKVYPLEVETVIRSVPGVVDTRVFGEASSIMGELVKCELVISSDHDPADVEAAVRKKTLSELNSFQRPRFIAIVDEIPRTAAGKTKRS